MTPKLPRYLSGKQLAKILSRLGYEITRQTGGHLRLTTTVNGEDHVTIPDHDHLKVGTLSGILGDVAQHLESTKRKIIEQLFR
jgi:predicted RNA binding protein YcfA (HicA-like mRNA interferase family)